MVLHFSVELYHKFFLINYMFTGSLFSNPKIFDKTLCILIGVSLFFAFREKFLKAYNKYLLLRIGIAYGNALAAARAMMAIVANTIFKPCRILFVSPEVDCAIICSFMAICIPTHKYVESHFGLGKNQVNIGFYKKSFIAWAIPTAAVILLEVVYVSHAKEFISYTLSEFHPL